MTCSANLYFSHVALKPARQKQSSSSSRGASKSSSPPRPAPRRQTEANIPQQPRRLNEALSHQNTSNIYTSSSQQLPSLTASSLAMPLDMNNASMSSVRRSHSGATTSSPHTIQGVQASSQIVETTHSSTFSPPPSLVTHSPALEEKVCTSTSASVATHAAIALHSHGVGVQYDTNGHNSVQVLHGPSASSAPLQAQSQLRAISSFPSTVASSSTSPSVSSPPRQTQSQLRSLSPFSSTTPSASTFVRDSVESFAQPRGASAPGVTSFGVQDFSRNVSTLNQSLVSSASHRSDSHTRNLSYFPSTAPITSTFVSQSLHAEPRLNSPFVTSSLGARNPSRGELSSSLVSEGTYSQCEPLSATQTDSMSNFDLTTTVATQGTTFLPEVPLSSHEHSLLGVSSSRALVMSNTTAMMYSLPPLGLSDTNVANLPSDLTVSHVLDPHISLSSGSQFRLATSTSSASAVAGPLQISSNQNLLATGSNISATPSNEFVSMAELYDDLPSALNSSPLDMAGLQCQVNDFTTPNFSNPITSAPSVADSTAILSLGHPSNSTPGLSDAIAVPPNRSDTIVHASHDNTSDLHDSSFAFPRIGTLPVVTNSGTDGLVAQTPLAVAPAIDVSGNDTYQAPMPDRGSLGLRRTTSLSQSFSCASVEVR